MRKTATCILLSLTLVSSMLPTAFARDEYATRGKVAEMLVSAADDYNPGVQKTDIIKGYEDGELHEERSVTRAEALVMLKRAFGTLPEPVGHNKRVGYTAENFNDIPEWAKFELQNVFDSGIVAGTGEGTFSPNENVTEEQMQLFISRVFALFGTNLKDDFYATVNKDRLNSLEIKPGRVIAGTLYDLSDDSTEQVSGIINDIISNEWDRDTKEYKIASLYNSILDFDSRNKNGIKPIKKYLEMIDKAENVDDLVKLQNTLYSELCVSPYFNFSLTVDLKDSTKYMLYFGTPSAVMQKEFYTEENEKKDMYLDYLTTVFKLSGESEEKAKAMAEQCFDIETLIAKNSLDVQDKSNVDLIYNVYTMADIQEMFPNANIDSVFKTSGFKNTNKIIITDVDKTKAFAEFFKDENVDALKSYARLAVVLGWGGALNKEFTEASNKFNREYFGLTGSYSDEELATMQTQSTMADYIGKIYAEKYFSEEAKKDVEKMVSDIASVYRKRLQNNDWMSDATKKKAIEKLDKMTVKIGYPDKWDTAMDDVKILSPKDGGTYFSNMLEISKATLAEVISLQEKMVDKTEWLIYPYTVNACYSATSNDITFPAAILQSPMYDVNASYEENLGGIGYIIAHEITHAFDNNGAKFDADGNAADWWTEEDYAAFNEKCKAMIDFYDGEEAVPGIAMNGTLTLSENVADQGAVSCLTEIVVGLENPNYKAFFESIAKCWTSTSSRDWCVYASQTDVHSADKLRVNRVIVNCDEFYEAFDITEKDGMYVSPKDRIKIW